MKGSFRSTDHPSQLNKEKSSKRNFRNEQVQILKRQKAQTWNRYSGKEEPRGSSKRKIPLLKKSLRSTWKEIESVKNFRKNRSNSEENFKETGMAEEKSWSALNTMGKAERKNRKSLKTVSVHIAKLSGSWHNLMNHNIRNIARTNMILAWQEKPEENPMFWDKRASIKRKKGKRFPGWFVSKFDDFPFSVCFYRKEGKRGTGRKRNEKESGSFPEAFLMNV